jgi:hypothetical protein
VSAGMPMPGGMRCTPYIPAETCMPGTPRLDRAMPSLRPRAASSCEARPCSPEEEGHRQNGHRNKPPSHLASPFFGLGGHGVGLPTFLHGITCLVPHPPAHPAAETGTFRAIVTDRLSYSTLARIKEFHAPSSTPLAAAPQVPFSAPVSDGSSGRISRPADLAALVTEGHRFLPNQVWSPA